MIRGHVRRARLVVSLLAAVAIATPASAIIIVNGKTGLFGVTGSQTIRVSVLNASDKGGINPCVGVFDLSGRMLVEIEAMPLRPGEGTFVDFDAATLGLRDGQRMQVRVGVELVGPPDDDRVGTGPPDDDRLAVPPPDDSCPGIPPPDDGRRVQPDDAILTLEVFDTATGRTAFTMPWVLVGFNPQPEPPARR